MHPIEIKSSDIYVISFYLFLILAIGILFREKHVATSSFVHASQKLPVAITTIAFLAANCGALEIVGIVSTTAKYGVLALHFYWIGAIPAILFLSLFMMPIYTHSEVLTVPEFLKLRYNQPTRILNAIAFAVMMLLTSGISPYAMAEILQTFVAWTFVSTIFVAAFFVFFYVAVGGLTAAIYNKVFQFFLTVFGLLPLVWMILRDFHSIRKLITPLPSGIAHLWSMPIASPGSGPMDFIGVAMGLGFILSGGYWCTDFVLIQRTLAARTLTGAINTALLASIAKLFFPVLVVIPGLAAASLYQKWQTNNYDQARPFLLQRYYSHRLLGIGVTVILASLMSGLAGNVTAFSTLCTHDLYRGLLVPDKKDGHYVVVARILMLIAILASIATAYIALQFNSLMDYLQLLFSVFNAPLFAVLLLGTFTTWATPAAGFWGLLAGIFASVTHNLAFQMHRLRYGSDMSANFYGAIVAWGVCLIVTMTISTFTERKPLKDLIGVTYQTRDRYRSPVPVQSHVLAFAIILICILLDIWFR